VEYAREVGTRILVTHAGGATLQTSDVEQQIKRSKEWAKLGAYLEVNGNSMLPNMMHPACDPNAAFDYMRELGPEHCVANTDFGQPTCEDPVDGFKRYVRCMIHFGFSEEEIKLMIRTNPAKLLYLED
jgi:hypothetical protein